MTSNGSTNIWRDSSYEFWRDDVGKGGGKDNDGFEFMQGDNNKKKAKEDEQDPPSKLIGEFLHKQKASGDFTLDIDLEMQELSKDGAFQSPLSSLGGSSPLRARSSKDQQKVSFEKQPLSTETEKQDGGAQVLRCTSNSAFRSDSSSERKSHSLNNAKSKSRLSDPPEDKEKRSSRTTKSGQTKSGFLMKRSDDDDNEEDSIFDEDLPERYKKGMLSIPTFVEWVSLVLIIGSLVCTLAIPSLREKNLWKLKLWKWEVLVLVLICGRLVSSWGIRIIVFFVERNFLLRKRVLYFVYGLRKAVEYCLWLGLVLIAWHFLFDKKVQREAKTGNLQYVTKVLVCLLVGSSIWLVKTLIVKVLASSFHVSTYFDRIQEALFNQYVIETLSGPPLMEMRRAEEEEQKVVVEVENLQKAGAKVPSELNPAVLMKDSGKMIGSGRSQKSPRGTPTPTPMPTPTPDDADGITIDLLNKLNPKNVSAWNMKRLMNLVRFGKLSTLDEQISCNDDESGNLINSEIEAKAAARRIFHNVARHGSRYIYLEDLMRFMTEEEAVKTMSLFEGASESEKISRSSLKNWTVNTFRERRALALTLDDTKTAVNKLHQMVNVLVGIIIVIIWLLILGIAIGKFLLVISSQLLLVVFIFGNSCKTTFEAIIFLFVMHPFDVGDRCEIDGVQMVVEEMNILTTVFLRYDNQKIIFPNSVLATKPISNYRRSPDMGDAVEFCIHVSTPAEKIVSLKQRIKSYIENKKEHWCPDPMIIFKELEELNRVRIAVWLTHTMNHQDMGEKFARRSLLIEEMAKIFQELDIEYRLYPIDINVRAMPPLPYAGLVSK